MRWVGVIKTTQFDKAEPDNLDKVFGRGRYAAA